MSKPSYAIYIRTDSPNPVVFTTANTQQERQALDAWIANNPDLTHLVARAIELAEREA